MYTSTLAKLDETEKFLGKKNLPRLDDEEIKLNRPVTSKEIESVIKKLLHRKVLDLMVSGEFYQIPKEELKLLLKLFQKN